MFPMADDNFPGNNNSQKARILLVEDSTTQAKATRDFLQKKGYDVLWADSGTAAIKAVLTMSPDVVLLDRVLPDMSGTEVCRWIKHTEQTKGVPVIMLTVRNSLDDKVTGIESGADDYLAKPCNDVELHAKIYAALRIKALQDALRQKNRELAELLAKVGSMAVTDVLTGLYNRRHFDDELDAEWKKSRRYRYSIACLLIDIDFFKSINDTCGHKAGDSVLKELSVILQKNVRDTDTVARWGGEEFIILLPHTDADGGYAVARSLLERISRYEFGQVPGRRITVSIGLSCSGPATQEKERLIEAADKALYEAKKNGRNRIECAPDTLPPS
jgi:two-component system cell cycle response regulator